MTRARMFQYLNRLREAECFDAVTYAQRAFALTETEAQDLVQEWVQLLPYDIRILSGA